MCGRSRRADHRDPPVPKSPSIVLLALVLLLGGCSAVQLAYNNADWWLARQFDRYFDLSAAQRTAVRDHLRGRMEQHRYHELADVVALLDGWHRALAQGLDAPTVERLMQQLDEVLAITVERSIPLLAAVMVDLDESQQAHLAQRLERLDRDYQRRHRLDDTELRRSAAREERLVERVEHWTGRLSGSQRALLSAHLADWPDLTRDWLDYRRHKQRELLMLLRTRPSSEAVSAFLRDGFELADQPAELRTGNVLMRARLREFLVALDETLTSSQRLRVMSRLDGYRTALAGLVPEEAPRIAEVFPSDLRLSD